MVSVGIVVGAVMRDVLYLTLVTLCLSACSNVPNDPGFANHPLDCAMGVQHADCSPGTSGYNNGPGRMQTSLDQYVGRPISDVILDRGPPTSTFDMGPNKRAFQWALTGQTAGAVVPISGVLVTVPPRTQNCMVSFVASANKSGPTISDWMVESWRWNGAC